MLSYQHGYHAGNLADVHKHALLAWMLDYMVRKPKPLTYLETHGGRGLYDLSGPEAAKTGEAAQGIARAQDWFDADHPYLRALGAVRVAHGATTYPGSPVLAGHLLRFEDQLKLAELHPSESLALKDAVAPFPADVRFSDGFEMAISWTPPDPRRGLLLCDPSFEVKDDYRTIPEFFGKLHKRWSVGVLVLWFPILTDGRHKAMLGDLRARFEDALLSTVNFPPAKKGHGMIGSGLFVVNPPYGLDKEANRVEKIFTKHL